MARQGCLAGPGTRLAAAGIVMLVRTLAVAVLRLYQYCISPLLGPSCRFYPCCSEYADQALRMHGWRGAVMAGRRILRCHPWHPGGLDPVPEASR